jgi:ABC-type dipeptide/oligopeptide/nickel transport system permease component
MGDLCLDARSVREDDPETVRAKGLPESRRIFQHAVKKAVPVMIAVWGWQFS